LTRRIHERGLPERFWDEYHKLSDQQDIRSYVSEHKAQALPLYFQKEYEQLKEKGEDYFRFKDLSQRLRLSYEDKILWMESKDTVIELGNLDGEGNLRFSEAREHQPIVRDLVETLNLEYEVAEKDFKVSKGIWVDERIREERGMPLYLNSTVIGYIDEEKGIHLETDMVPAEAVKQKLGELEVQFEVDSGAQRFQPEKEELKVVQNEIGEEVRFTSRIVENKPEEPSAILVMHSVDYENNNTEAAIWVNVNGFEQGEGEYLKDEIQEKFDELTADDSIDRDIAGGFVVMDKSGLIQSRSVPVNDADPDLDLYIEEHLKAAGKYTGIKADITAGKKEETTQEEVENKDLSSKKDMASELVVNGDIENEERVNKNGAREDKTVSENPHPEEDHTFTEVVSIEEIELSRKEFNDKLQENGEKIDAPVSDSQEEKVADEVEEQKEKIPEPVTPDKPSEKDVRATESLEQYPYQNAFPISEDTITDDRWKGMVVGRERDIVFTIQNQRNIFFSRNELEAMPGYTAHESFQDRSTIVLGNALKTRKVEQFILAENPREMLSYYELNKAVLKVDSRSLKGSHENGHEKEGRVDQ
jgi:hypothetical protein